MDAPEGRAPEAPSRKRSDPPEAGDGARNKHPRVETRVGPWQHGFPADQTDRILSGVSVRDACAVAMVCRSWRASVGSNWECMFARIASEHIGFSWYLFRGIPACDWRTLCMLYEAGALMRFVRLSATTEDGVGGGTSEHRVVSFSAVTLEDGRFVIRNIESVDSTGTRDVPFAPFASESAFHWFNAYSRFLLAPSGRVEMPKHFVDELFVDIHHSRGAPIFTWENAWGASE